MLSQTPYAGESYVSGGLRARGIFVQRHRIRDILSEIDPVGRALRRRAAIQRRQYNVRAPNHLWHIDGNHKLVNWRFVIHGCECTYQHWTSLIKTRWRNQRYNNMSEYNMSNKLIVYKWHYPVSVISYWTGCIETTGVVSSRLHVCGGATWVCVEATLYRNDRIPFRRTICPLTFVVIALIFSELRRSE